MTALFADVVGSTSLAERLPPDEVKALMGECVTRMSTAVEEFGGMVQAYTGDGICAYFGVPAAHEDDPERAALAALQIVSLVRDYGREIAAAWGIPDFDVRVGINSGRAGVGVVGDADPQTVALGDITNVAARIQSVVEPGTIGVGDATAKRLGDSFVLEARGDELVKGRTEPVRTWRLLAVRDASEHVVRTPFVDREDEVARLERSLAELRAGRGQIVSLVGETGLGKSRLVERFRSLSGSDVEWLEGRCGVHGSEFLYPAFVDMLRGWLGLSYADEGIAARARLRAKVGATLGPAADEPLAVFVRLLGLQVEHEQPHVGPEHIRDAFAALLESLSSQRPVAIVVEDVDLADEATRTVLEGLLELTDRAALLLLATYGPDPATEAWRFRLRVLADYAHRATELELGPLPPPAAAALAEALTPEGTLDEASRNEILDRAEGNPLYVEELLRALIESGGLERKRSWTLTARTEELVPPALEGLLIARIDRLSPDARRLVQLAAVVGRTFPQRLLELLEGDAVGEELRVLLRADIVREVRRYPEPEFAFKHGLLQEAALSTLPPGRRRSLYGRVAVAFEQLFRDALDQHLDRLAHYYSRSGELPKALHYLERAGEKALELQTIGQAAEFWRRARKVAVKLEDAEAERRLSGRLADLG